MSVSYLGSFQVNCVDRDRVGLSSLPRWIPFSSRGNQLSEKNGMDSGYEGRF